MHMRSMWLEAHPNRSVLQEGSKGPLPEGACDSPIGWGEHGPGSAHAKPCEELQYDQPATRALPSTPSVKGIHPDGYQWGPPLVTAAVRVYRALPFQPRFGCGSGGPPMPHDSKEAIAVQSNTWWCPPGTRYKDSIAPPPPPPKGGHHHLVSAPPPTPRGAASCLLRELCKRGGWGSTDLAMGCG